MDYAHQFAEQIIPDPWRVFGVALKPFTVGHSILLERIKSPFAFGGNADVDDIARAILFFTSDFEGGVKSLYRRTLSQKVWQWRFKVWAFFNKDKALAGRLILANYISEARGARPSCFVNKSKTAVTHAPDSLITIATLLRLGYTECEALNMPYGKANWLYYGWLHSEGAVDFKDPKHSDLFSRVAAAQRKAKEEAAKEQHGG